MHSGGALKCLCLCSFIIFAQLIIIILIIDIVHFSQSGRRGVEALPANLMMENLPTTHLMQNQVTRRYYNSHAVSHINNPMCLQKFDAVSLASAHLFFLMDFFL